MARPGTLVTLSTSLLTLLNFQSPLKAVICVLGTWEHSGYFHLRAGLFRAGRGDIKGQRLRVRRNL